MEFKSKIELQQLKKMTISHLLHVQELEKENARFKNVHFSGITSLTYQSEQYETDLLLNKIENELKSIES